jgi:hypothetical protein
MSKRITPPKAAQPIPPMICRNREEVTLALKKARECRGHSQNELDEMAGFHVGYTGKLEQPFPRAWPSGRSVMHPMFDIWLAALGVAVIIVPDTHAVDGKTIGDAAPPMPVPPRMNLKRANRIRTLYREGWKVTLLSKHFNTPKALVVDIVENRAFAAPGASDKAA